MPFDLIWADALADLSRFLQHKLELNTKGDSLIFAILQISNVAS